MTLERLLSVLRPCLDEPRASWLDASLAADPGNLTHLVTTYARASRAMGQDLVAPVDADLTGWTLEDGARAAILLQLAESGPAEHFEAAALACYEQGDSREQQSWLKAVAFFPRPERFLRVVIDACRTNIVPLFSAVACDNAYPARYFPEANFNQMVLKALFNGVPLSRVQGLNGRLNPELARMARDYAAERTAAGRSVPSDIALVISPTPAPQEQT